MYVGNSRTTSGDLPEFSKSYDKSKTNKYVN